jgi:hypothetical protein
LTELNVLTECGIRQDSPRDASVSCRHCRHADPANTRPGHEHLVRRALAHLDAHPDGEFTPHEIHKVNGHSSGAIANALETLVKLGEAEVATEKPRRFRRAAQPAAAAPEADGADSGEQDGTGLAGTA